LGRTYKDSRRQGTVVEVLKRTDGAFDLFINRKLDREGVHEDGLPAELCVRFGYCGQEYDDLLKQLHQSGRVEVSF
jgi:hypothetical protein